MSTELIQSLSHEPSRLQVEALLRGALREPAFAELDALLHVWIDEHPGPLTALCRDVGDVAVTGWDALDADIAALAARGTLCSAVGIDLTGHHEGDGPGLEVSLYSDKSFPFSTSDRAAILAACERYGTDWQGAFDDIGHSLTCTGLETLCAAVTGHPHRHWYGGSEMPDDYPDYFIGVWFLYTRANQALAAALDSNNLPYPMPVLVSEHDFGPWFATVHVTDKGVAEATEQADLSVAPETAQPETELPEVELPEVELPQIVAAEAEPITEAVSPPVPSRGWPWRKTQAKGGDAANAADDAPVTQRRRGPGSFAG